jgi:hypothetical protein
LDSHAAKKDFWTQGFVFISKDDNLNKAHVQYLEARLCELAAAAKRVELDNGNTPARPSLSEADVAEMEAFLAEMLVCFPVLGLSAFESVAERPRAARVFFAKARGTDARGFETDEGFVVQSGSMVSSTEVDSIPPSFSAMRRQLFEAGVLASRGDQWVLTQDYVFGSPSSAATVVLGRNANGRVEWKDEKGRTLKQVQDSDGSVDATPSRPNTGDVRIANLAKIIGVTTGFAFSKAGRTARIDHPPGLPSRHRRRNVLMFMLAGASSGEPCQMRTSSARVYPLHSG